MARFLGLCPVAQFARSAESGQIAELPDLALHQLFVEPICPNNGSDQDRVWALRRAGSAVSTISEYPARAAKRGRDCSISLGII